MIRAERYIEWAAEYGCPVGTSGKWPAPTSSNRAEDRVNRAVLKAIDMNIYPQLLRRLLTRKWGRKSIVTRWEGLIKEFRSNDNTKPE
jgi:hypothetical protein